VATWSSGRRTFLNLLHKNSIAGWSVKTIQLLAEVITTMQVRFIELVGTCQDVSEQRMAEIKFRGLSRVGTGMPW